MADGGQAGLEHTPPFRLQNQYADSSNELQTRTGYEFPHCWACTLLPLHHRQIHRGAAYRCEDCCDSGCRRGYDTVHREIRCGRGTAGAADETTEQTGGFESGAAEVALGQGSDHLDSKKQEGQT